MQVPSGTDPAEVLDRLVADGLPGGRGVEAWRSLLIAHATLMRRLGAELEAETGLSLSEFDVLAQLAGAHGALRMTELSERAFSSRSGMTRRIDRLVAQGLVRRVGSASDAREVVVSITDAGLARLQEVAPVHVRGVARLFVDQLDDQELALLERALKKVIADCSFG
jgi:DNA-binding MarR family transcriptional regulator